MKVVFGCQLLILVVDAEFCRILKIGFHEPGQATKEGVVRRDLHRRNKHFEVQCQ